MPAQSGSTLIIETSDDGGSTWTALACSREDSFSGEVGEINVTDKCSSNYRELLAGGIKSLSLSTSGIVKDNTLLETFLAGAVGLYRVSWEDSGDTLEGNFQIGTFSQTANYENSAIEFTAELRSSGAFTYTAGP